MKLHCSSPVVRVVFRRSVVNHPGPEETTARGKRDRYYTVSDHIFVTDLPVASFEVNYGAVLVCAWDHAHTSILGRGVIQR